MNDTSNNSPLTRLNNLERQVDELQNNGHLHPAFDPEKTEKTYPIWKADEQLLLTCLRRFPSVMDAYIQKGTLTVDSNDKVTLTISGQDSVYKYVILKNGDAVLWTDLVSNRETEGRRRTLSLLYDIDFSGEFSLDSGSLIKLAYFLPVEQGKKWVLWQKGIIQNTNLSLQSVQDSKKNDYSSHVRNLESRIYEQEQELLNLKSELSQCKIEIKEILHVLLQSRGG